MFPHVSANATMAEGGRESELVVADVPEDQKHLICVEYPGIHSQTRNFSLCSRHIESHSRRDLGIRLGYDVPHEAAIHTLNL